MLRWRAILGGVTLAFLVGLAYWPALQGGFSYDDFSLLRLARDSWSIESPGGFLWKSHNALLTPLGNLLFWLEFQVFGLDRVGYQVLSMLLHWANSCLLGGFVYTLEKKWQPALLAGMLFAVAFPVQEAVGWVAAYLHLLAGLFYFGALLAHTVWIRTGRPVPLATCLVLLAVGTLVKEDILTAPFLILLLTFLVWRKELAGKRAWYIGSGLIGALGLVYAVVVAIWHSSIPGSSTGIGIYQVGSHGIANYRYLVGLLLPPPDYIPFVSFVGRILPAAFLDVYAAVAWSLLVPLALWFAWALWKGNSSQRLAVLLTLTAYAPFAMTTVGISLRYLYIPYAGFATLLAVTSYRVTSRVDARWALAALVLWTGAHITATWVWQLRMNENARRRESMIATLAAAYDNHPEAVNICIEDIPEKYLDVPTAVPLYITRKSAPAFYLEAADCPASATLRFHFENDLLVPSPEGSGN